VHGKDKNMFRIPDSVIKSLKEQYQVGTRVELVFMNDDYRKLLPGEKGTVIGVDDIGTIHVNWDCGSSLGVVYGEDCCRKICND
jgi:hypothetical protein